MVVTAVTENLKILWGEAEASMRLCLTHYNVFKVQRAAGHYK